LFGSLKGKGGEGFGGMRLEGKIENDKLYLKYTLKV